jgi:hypothetical protein
VSWLTGTEIYLASKILTLLIIANLFFLLARYFRKTAWLYALVIMSNPNMLKIFYYTWSEQPFIFGLIWFVCTMQDIIQSNRSNWTHYLKLFIAATLMFLTRYIGICALLIAMLGLVFLLFEIFFRKKQQNLAKSFGLIIFAVLFMAVVASYFYANYIHTGNIGGNYRNYLLANHKIDYFISITGFLRLGIKHFNQIFPFLEFKAGFTTLLLLGLLLWYGIHNHFFSKYKLLLLWLVRSNFAFIVSFLAYLLFCLAMSFTTDAAVATDSRFLTPALILFYILCLNSLLAWQKQLPLNLKRHGYFIVFLICFIFIMPELKVCLPTVKWTAYRNIWQRVRHDVAGVPPRSLLISHWGQPASFVNFIRPDCVMIDANRPYPLSLVQHFVSENENVYLYLDNYDEIQNKPYFKKLLSNKLEKETRLIRIIK